MTVFRSTLTVVRWLALLVLMVVVCPDAPSSAASIEDRLATYLRKRDASTLASCTLHLVKGLVVAERRGDPIAAAKAEARYAECRSLVLRDWLIFRNALVSGGGLPVCLDTTIALDGLHSELVRDFDLTMANLFCDGATMSHGIHVPSDASVYRHETKVARIVLRFSDRKARCSISYASRLAAAAGDPEAVASAEVIYHSCYHAAAFAAYGSLPRFYASSSGPPCLPVAAAEARLQDYLASWDVLDSVYCAP